MMITVPPLPKLTIYPKSPRAIVTVVVGEDALALHEITREPMERYARRLGADFVVLDWPGNRDWPMSCKYAIPQVLDHYQRIAYLDVDVLVRPTSVDLFSLCDTDEFGAFDELPQAKTHHPMGEQIYREFRETMGFAPIATLPFYLNAGVLVVGKQHKKYLLPPDGPMPATHSAEQDHTNAKVMDAFLAGELKVKLLDRKANWQGWGGARFRRAPSDAILHYCAVPGSGLEKTRLEDMQAQAKKFVYKDEPSPVEQPYDLPCLHRGEPTGKTEQCGCSLSMQPSYFCNSPVVEKEVCLMRIGARAKRGVKDTHAECCRCEERFDPTPVGTVRREQRQAKVRDVIKPRPGDVYREQQRLEMELRKERARHPFDDSPKVDVDHSQPTLVLNMGAGGLGDACLGLTAAAGLKAQLPEKTIVYRCGRDPMNFIQHFEGYDQLTQHDHEYSLGSRKTTDLQVNTGYRMEISGKDTRSRINRYCANIGADTWVLPKLRTKDMASYGREYSGFIGLSPFAAHLEREVPLNAWLALERVLLARGHKVVIVDRHIGRCNVFQSPKATELPADKVIGVLLNLRCMVGNDSGLQHLAGLLGVRSIVLCGQTRGDRIFNAYPTATWMHGEWGCEGCYWSGKWNSSCRPRCPSLSSILPERIAEEIERG